MICHNSKIKSTGFTMLELTITVAIIGILSAIAIPNLVPIIKNNRIQSETDKLFIALNQTRNLAISKNTMAFFCRTYHEFSQGTLDCNTNNSSQLNWHDHNYMVYSINPDNQTQQATLRNRLANNNTQPNGTVTGLKLNQVITTAADQKEQVKLFEEGARDSLVTINTNRRVHVVAFKSDGTLYNDAPIYFAVCDDRNNPEDYGRYIQINQSGRIRVVKTNTNQTITDCQPGT